MTAPRTTPNRTPPGSPRITSHVPANTPPRRTSKVLASSMGPAGRTLIMLMVGGSSHISNQLVLDWQQLAEDAECNFCAIEAGEGAESDAGLVELLRMHVPEGAAVYVVQRDAEVSEREIAEVQHVLAELNIPLASDQVLLADQQSAWTFELEILSSPAHRLIDAQRFEHADASLGGHPKLHNEFVRSTQQLLDEAKRNRTELRIEMYKLNLKLHKELTFIDSLGAQLQQQIDAGIDFDDPESAVSQRLIHAFNELQFTKHWQASAGTAEAKVLRHLVAEVYRRDEDTQSRVEFPLLILLCHMRHDPALCRAVLNAVAKLSIDQDGVMAISDLCMACMEQRVASGALDDEPLVALDFARCVQRSRLLAEIYLRERAALEDSAEYHPRLRAEICIAFDQALMAVALHGGREEVSFDELTDPLALATVRSALQEMKQLGNEGFNEFLRGWAPWQALASRREPSLAAQQPSAKD